MSLRPQHARGIPLIQALETLHAPDRVAALELELAEYRRREGHWSLRQAEWSRREADFNDFVEGAIVGLQRIDANGRVLWANAAEYAPLGYAAQEYIGHLLGEFQADPALFAGILARVVAGEAVHDERLSVRARDGTLRHVLFSCNASIEEGAFRHARCVTRDVSGQQLAEEALQDAALRIAAIVESSQDAVLAVDLQGRITSWNASATQLLGYAEGEMLGRRLTDIAPLEHRAQEDRVASSIAAGQRVNHYDAVLIARDGRMVDLSVTASPLRDGPRLVGVSRIARDVSEGRRAQRELADAVRRKDEFLAILAHELRNPLAPIRYALAIARQEESTASHRLHAQDVIERQVDHMSRLLDDLLDVSRIERGRVELRKATVDARGPITVALDAARPLIERKSHHLSIDLPREPLLVEVDGVRLTQVVTNLLTNAAKYTAPGGRIALALRADGDVFEVRVRDNGIGFTEEMAPRLFTLFAQASSALHRSEGGLGIGLALVKGFVELHAGQVEARSDGPGCGSTFIVRIPMGQPQDLVVAPAPALCAIAPLRVLVADDNADSAETSAALLQLWGHRVRIAHNGAEALAMAEQFRPQVALVDIGMPVMNGYTVAEQLRAQSWARELLLVAITGWGQEQDRARAALAGFHHHLTKPVAPERLGPILASAKQTF